MNSCIYRGTIRHRRQQPVENNFDYNVYLMFLDLDELDQVFDRRWLWSTNRPAFAWFNHRDHLKNYEGVRSAVDIKPAVIEILRDNGIERPIGPVRILTQLRHLFFVMNPVSFYYCYSPDGERLEAIVAEVNNTPWGEQHIYVLDAEKSESERMLVAKNIKKDFHVSPFMSLEMNYVMKFTSPGKKLAVKIENSEGGKKFFDVCMLLKRQPITGRSLAMSLIQYPLISMKIFAGIYWQAIRLFAKKCRYYPHPKNADKDDDSINKAIINRAPY